jgi:hypothetical protein
LIGREDREGHAGGGRQQAVSQEEGDRGEKEGDVEEVRFERRSVDDKGWTHQEEESRPEGARTETLGDGIGGEGGGERERKIGEMEGDLADLSEDRQQQRENPGVHRWMRIAAHVHFDAGGDMAEVGGMERLNLGVLGHRQVIGVVTLDGVVEERKPQQQDGDEDDEAVRQRAYCSRSPAGLPSRSVSNLWFFSL